MTRNPLTDPEPGDVLRDKHGRLIKVAQVACMRPLWVVVDIGPEFEHSRRWWAEDMWRIYTAGATVVTTQEQQGARCRTNRNRNDAETDRQERSTQSVHRGTCESEKL